MSTRVTGDQLLQSSILASQSTNPNGKIKDDIGLGAPEEGRSKCDLNLKPGVNLLLSKMVQRHVDGIVDHSKEDNTEPITRIEECALRYVAGYVCKHLVEKLKKSSHPSRDKLIWCLHKLEVDGESESDNDSTAWIESIDRGGLWHISGSVYPVFYAMEEGNTKACEE
ncbi:hypothetical protein EMCRGX_G009877 [Ephydatia muelleri]